MTDPKIPLADLPYGLPGTFDRVAGVDAATGAARLFPMPIAGEPKDYQTRASLPSASGLPDGTTAHVNNDPTTDNNGRWAVFGGQWVQSADRVTGLEAKAAEIERKILPSTVGKNLLDKAFIRRGFNVNGTYNRIIENLSWRISGFIPVIPGETYSVSGVVAAMSGAWFSDADDDAMISFVNNITSGPQTAPANARFLVINITNAGQDVLTYDSTAQVEVGTVPTSYEPYELTVPQSSIDGLPRRLAAIEANQSGQSFHEFDEAKTATTSTNGTILLGTPIPFDLVITRVKLRNGTARPSVQIVIADRHPDNTFTVAQSFPVSTVAGVNSYDVFIRAQEGQYIGVSSTIAMGVDTAVKTQPYMKFTSPVSTTPQAPLATLSDAQIALSYDSLDVADEIEFLREGAAVQIGTGAALPVNSAVASAESPSPLFIADTFGLNQPLHPTVEYFPDGFNGYKYVMVQTPFPQSANTVYKDRYECPTIHYSNDGISWTAGILIDDLTPAEIENRDYFSDPELLWNPQTSQLELWYRITRGTAGSPTDILRRIINANGTFGTRETLITAAQMDGTHHVRSPALLFEDGKYKMWFTGYSGGNVGYAETTDPTNFASWTWQAVSLGSGATNCWHLDVVNVGGTYYLFNNTTGANAFDLQLYSGSTETAFAKVKDILNKTLNPADFYGEVVYRASALVVDGVHNVYVSGWNASGGVSSIGLMRGESFEALKLVDGGYRRNDTRVGGNLRLTNTQYIKSLIELDDRGNSIGFDYATETLFFQRSTGERIRIVK